MKRKARKRAVIKEIKKRKKPARKQSGPADVEELLLSALGSEAMAMEFYSKAARKAQSNAGKQLFQELAVFEQNHYEHVRDIIEERNLSVKIGPRTYAPAFKDIKPEVAGEFESNKDEIVGVLNLGIKGEKDAQARYRRIAAMMKDKESMRIFENLAEDERRHLNLLESEFYQLSNKGTIIWE